MSFISIDSVVFAAEHGVNSSIIVRLSRGDRFSKTFRVLVNLYCFETRVKCYLSRTEPYLLVAGGGWAFPHNATPVRMLRSWRETVSLSALHLVYSTITNFSKFSFPSFVSSWRHFCNIFFFLKSCLSVQKKKIEQYLKLPVLVTPDLLRHGLELKKCARNFFCTTVFL